MVWYEKALAAMLVVLTGAGIVNLFWPLGLDPAVWTVGGGLGLLGVVLIIERRKREARRGR